MCSVEECEAFVAEVKKKSPKIAKLLQGVKGEEPTIGCRPCSSTGAEGNARAALFDSDPLEVVLCTNRLKKESLEEALTHELVHAFDFSNNRCDFRYCDGLAYAEIRAARYAECKGPFMFEWMRDRCIKDTATSSTKNFFADAESCVRKSYASAMADEAP